MNNDLVITGIPRSGTSYVCSLLNAVENTVLVNEPVEALQYLRNDSSRTMAGYYADTRERILGGKPIQNKIVDGRFTEDTNENDSRSYYVPEVKDASFVFGTKNTFVYLVSLEKLGKQLPGAAIIACVRHPYDAISSWKRVRFPHLKNADPSFFAAYASEQGKREIAGICAIPLVEIRYAAMWDFLARRMLGQLDNLLLLKYEELVTDPARYLAAVYNALGLSMQVLPEMPASRARTRRGGLSAAEMDAIRQYCSGSARDLGYEL